ncbi:putative F-box/LRR-repeat protein At3g58880 [Eucalyptus grandis]|uniref:putative F-box/LRR-repeat protein At3g58880 n=1 Tax=Eucalyptus grandis TaxID=71139 RepID=UPI00192E9BF2|nr:putative F-box/LRR-repeat protein At3g58880 [Eucalyptus grandis]
MDRAETELNGPGSDPTRPTPFWSATLDPQMLGYGGGGAATVLDTSGLPVRAWLGRLSTLEIESSGGNSGGPFRVSCDGDTVKLNPKDRISSLPEDVIGFMLSLMTSREAQATCLLSRRWRYLSTCQVTNLDFDWSDLLAKMKANPEIAEKERARYVEWVDNVLHRQSGGYHLRRFTLRFDLNISYKLHIDKWIRFALAKRVKVLQLDFEPATFKDLMHDCDPTRLPYLLGHETLMDDDVGCSQRTSVVNGELIEQLLANCPVLEQLVLEEAHTLNRFRVSGRSLKLKYLRILWCDDLEYIEIYDTDLVSFTFVGMRIPICLDKLPQLSEVSIRGSSLEHLHVMLPPQLLSLP